MERILRTRFEQNSHRHVPRLKWDAVWARLQSKPECLRSLAWMEETGGEPDLVDCDAATGELWFFDCSPETPAGRTSTCYDAEALRARKTAKPRHSAVAMAVEAGVELLTEAQYRDLQALGEFDTKTSSWVLTPAELRRQGGALFGDRRYGRVFIYHNGAQSYFSSRGFRTCLRV